LSTRDFPTDLSLDAQELTLSRGGRKLLSGLSFVVKSGEALLVTGPNGAGKSTLLRTLAGLLTPTQGRITLRGAPEPELPGLAAHYIGHADSMKATLTAEENLEFWAAMLSAGAAGGKTPGLSASAALERMGLPHLLHLPVGYLSAGQKRRVGLARLLVAPRPLWLLDEPSTALDVAAQ
jgi:heme exporter protein A